MKLKRSTVYRLEFADHGQDCTAWYVRNRAIIDCEPCPPRVIGALSATS